mgnify:FL=1
MNRVIRFIAGWIFINTLHELLHIGIYNPEWWILTASFYFILGFTED